MLFPNFNERAEDGQLTISSNMMKNTDPVEIQIEDKEHRLVVNLAIESHHLMRALMNHGNMPCKFISLKITAAHLELTQQARTEIKLAVKDRDEALAALRELVELKDIKDDRTFVEIDDPRVLDYTRRKPLAWAEARRIVGHSRPKGGQEGPLTPCCGIAVEGDEIEVWSAPCPMRCGDVEGGEPAPPTHNGEPTDA